MRKKKQITTYNIIFDGPNATITPFWSVKTLFWGEKGQPKKRSSTKWLNLLYPFMVGLRLCLSQPGIQKGPAFASPFYTPKRFRTAVAGMKIPSPGPLDDRGVLCRAKYS